MFQPRFVREYRRVVRSLLARHDRDTAMAEAVGGGPIEAMADRHLALLRAEGLRDSDSVVDVGCGSGRTAYALRDMPQLRYLGTDVVPELLRYAEEKAARPDWSFELVDGLRIPAADNSADLILFFSVVTHLKPVECRLYLADAVRVARPGGKIIVSYLDRDNELHRKAASDHRPVAHLISRWCGRHVLNVLLHRSPIGAACCDECVVEG